MAPLYKIKDWNRYYETHETRKLKKLTWIPCPLKHDGKGFRRIMKNENSAIIYTAWMLILQIAAKCPERGTLRDDDGNLREIDLADKTGFKEDYFKIAFNFLSSNEIGWIEKEESPETSRDLPKPSGRTEQNRTEQNGMEQKDIKNGEPPLAGSFNQKSEKKKSSNVAFEINGTKVPYSFYMSVLKKCDGDVDKAGHVFFRAKCRADKNVIGWISSGLMENKDGEYYALKSIREEDEDPQAVREWIDKVVNHYKEA
jgi:hypothetical protein